MKSSFYPSLIILRSRKERFVFSDSHLLNSHHDYDTMRVHPNPQLHSCFSKQQIFCGFVPCTISTCLVFFVALPQCFAQSSNFLKYNICLNKLKSKLHNLECPWWGFYLGKYWIMMCNYVYNMYFALTATYSHLPRFVVNATFYGIFFFFPSKELEKYH